MECSIDHISAFDNIVNFGNGYCQLAIYLFFVIINLNCMNGFFYLMSKTFRSDSEVIDNTCWGDAVGS